MTFEEFSYNLISLGLAPDQHTVRKIMLAVKGEGAIFPEQLSLREFSRLFDINRFGNAASELINNEFKAENEDFAH